MVIWMLEENTSFWEPCKIVIIVSLDNSFEEESERKGSSEEGNREAPNQEG